VKLTRIVVTKGATITEPDGKTWSKFEYSLELALEAPNELDIAKAEAEATINAWLAANTTVAPPATTRPEPGPKDINALVANALSRATPMKDKPGSWCWSSKEPELKNALLSQDGKATVAIGGKRYDVKLGDGEEEKDAFISFWPRTGR